MFEGMSRLEIGLVAVIGIVEDNEMDDEEDGEPGLIGFVESAPRKLRTPREEKFV